MVLKLQGRASFKPQRGKINNETFLPRKDSDQPVHPPSLISVFAVRMEKLNSFALQDNSRHEGRNNESENARHIHL